ncbi:uncharacterized protein LOC111384405 [Olea europaea var. sylvestris]|uniref:uncharacterized protein LOC111384405 n=1 Tax=Olea europaea var. sylvestris TaxID=158386 RepID=UPI000C1D8383|nr:uncharacterized protein LOC111384405 [Olea europaea var. sylvestris]
MFSSKRVVPPKVAKIYELDSTTSTNAQKVALIKEVELLVKSQIKGAYAVIAGPSCKNYGANHLTENCTSLGFPEEQIYFIQNGPRNFNPFSQTYNPGWRQHLNIRWSDNQQGNSSNNNQQASIKKLETQIGQIAQQLAKRPQGTLPGNTMVNLKEQVQVIATRSGVQLPEIRVKRLDRKDKEVMGKEAGTKVESEQPTNEEDKRKEIPSLVKAYVPPIPFPQRLQRKKLDKQFAKFVENFKTLDINISFTDPIAQMPSYAKFLKEILSNKRKLEEHEIVYLNEECSASVNLMPLFIYRSLGLGEAKPTTISLQLADRLIK